MAWTHHGISQRNYFYSSKIRLIVRGGSRAAAIFKMECFVIIVKGLEAVNYYHKAFHLGRCSSPRSASDSI